MLLSLAGAAAGLSLLGDVVTSSIASRQPPALAQLPAALVTVAAEDYCPVIPPGDPDFFDYDCQQSKVQVLVRGGRPLIMAQSWTSGDTASTGASVWPSSVMLSRYMEDQGAPYWKGKAVLELGGESRDAFRMPPGRAGPGRAGPGRTDR